MKKLLLIFSSVLLIAGCTATDKAPEATTIPTSDAIVTPTPTMDTPKENTIVDDGVEYVVAISHDDVKKIVLDKEPTAIIEEIDFDAQNDVAIYDLDVIYNNQVYDVKIDANSGDIILWQVDK